MAIEKDKMTAKLDQKALPPLHGLPMSFKDHIQVKGFIDTGGYSV